jgi:hypothetical protein
MSDEALIADVNTLSLHLNTLRTILVSNRRDDGTLLIPAELFDDLSTAISCYARWAAKLEQEAADRATARIIPFEPRRRVPQCEPPHYEPEGAA